MKYWTKSWNTIYGCTKCRAGCVNCWAEIMARRMQANGIVSGIVDEGGNWTGKIEYKPKRLTMPIGWKSPEIIAVNWMSDTFHPNSGDVIYPMYNIMEQAPQHTYLILTKRYQEAARFASTKPGLPSARIGVTISNQKDADEALSQIESYVVKRSWKWWVSYEPALEPVNWDGWDFLDGLVCGAESGHKKRNMPLEAALEARNFCYRHGVAFTFKQGNMGEETLLGQGHYEFPYTGSTSVLYTPTAV